MIINSDWLQPEESAYFHNISSDCISKLTEVVKKLSNGEIYIETAFRRYEQILNNEINNPQFLSFAIGNLDELCSYIAQGSKTIRIHRNDVDEIWFEIDDKSDP